MSLTKLDGTGGKPSLALIAILIVIAPHMASAKSQCVCGLANGQTLTSAPTSGLCLRGFASPVTGAANPLAADDDATDLLIDDRAANYLLGDASLGPWTWNCAANYCMTATCEAY